MKEGFEEIKEKKKETQCVCPNFHGIVPPPNR